MFRVTYCLSMSSSFLRSEVFVFYKSEIYTTPNYQHWLLSFPYKLHNLPSGSKLISCVFILTTSIYQFIKFDIYNLIVGAPLCLDWIHKGLSHLFIIFSLLQNGMCQPCSCQFLLFAPQQCLHLVCKYI